MKILNAIIELVTSPISSLLKINVGKKIESSKLALPLGIFVISLLIAGILVLYFYYSDLFN